MVGAVEEVGAKLPVLHGLETQTLAAEDLLRNAITTKMTWILRIRAAHMRKKTTMHHPETVELVHQK